MYSFFVPRRPLGIRRTCDPGYAPQGLNPIELLTSRSTEGSSSCR